MFTPFLSSAIKRAFYISLFVFSVPLFSQWSVQNSGTTVDICSIFTLNSNTVIASGKAQLPAFHGEILKSTNGGIAWKVVFYDSMYRPQDIQFVNQQTGFVPGGLYTSQFKLLKTTDAGNTWQLVYFNNTTPEPAKSSIYFLNELTGFACGFLGSIAMTTNSGANWIDVFSWNPQWMTTKLHCIRMINDLYGWCVGDSGKIARTTNGGQNWIKQIQVTTATLRSVAFIDQNTGFIAGDSGQVFRTSDAGALWLRIATGTSQNLKSLYFANASTGFACGGTGLILKTTTAGNSWFTLNSFVTDSLNSIRFSGTDTGYAVGNGGRIIKTTTGGVIGITQISSGVPKEFSLNQNYPNPFNPSTEFEFNIAKAGQVKITVFDILGNNIEVLVNGELKPGTYKAHWNASQFASGVYLYRIETSGFTLTKKMTLLK